MQERSGGAGSAEPRAATPPEEPLSFAGEVRAIDRASGKITLKHAAMPVLDVPAATADYPVKDTAVLERLNVGDRVRFTAVLQGRALLITKILAAN